MKVLEVFVNSVERLMAGMVGLIMLIIMITAFATAPNTNADYAAASGESRVALAQPLREPTMARAYTALKRNGRIGRATKGTVHTAIDGKITLNDQDKRALNATYRHYKRSNSARSSFSSHDYDDEVMYRTESGGWGSDTSH